MLGWQTGMSALPHGRTGMSAFSREFYNGRISRLPTLHSTLFPRSTLREMDNAVTQAIKEVITCYDFKGTAASISELNKKDKELTITGDAERAA